ncbi:MAG: valine--tRNA ligase [Patescibacteria group bacterium]|nr:valine--tRNA ligase [Patescibacteria group bacterium]
MLKKELPKAYNPADYEDAIYAQWEKSGFFNPDNLKGDPYSIMMPPPNVTGVLHLGHALENSLMDIMARYQRMNGKKVLLLPGTDHAAVATQAKVEKVLVEQGMKNPRQELGREKLLEKIREYAEDSKSTILKQIRKMGTSCDWSRLAYTFDEARGRAVNEVFIKMYNDGLIYRGNRVVNWSVKGQSTCSDDELVHVERPAKLYTFKYAKDFPIAVATTRPETKLGDTAVAVNSKDKRYKKYIGQVFKVEVGAAKPLEIKIIADENVEMEFGTGAVGVTPAHSMVDFEMFEKQKAKGDNIGLVQVIGQNGKMTEAAGKEYAGLTVLEAREKFIDWLNKEKLLEKEEDITQNVGTSDRFGDAVEVLPMTQWFIDVNKKIPNKDKSLKDLMREAVTIGHNGDDKQKVKITPDRFAKVYLNWIDNLRDWCISRQIWWGHRIPVWYKKEEIYVGEKEPGDGWKQDEDTLDTWFSSGLWTFSTLGWPASAKATADKPVKTSDLKTFHPTSWMQMGYEILFFWMARMILMSTYALDQIPFKDVYIHGMLRNEMGKKFSKSSGNNLNPLEVAAKFGTDALRLSLISGIAPGNDSKFYEEKVEGARNMVNKLWNISRFIIGNNQLPITNFQLNAKKITLADKWILSKISWLIYETSINCLENYQFSQAGEELRIFTWNDLADWYLEISKFEDNKEKEEILIYILSELLKLWHPFIPFVTETIWQEMGNKGLLMVEKWPDRKGSDFNFKVSVEFDLIKDIIIAIRNARSGNKVEPAKKIKAVIYAGKQKDLIDSQVHLIKGLRTGISELKIKVSGEKISGAIYAAVGDIEIYLLGAVDAEKEKARLEKEISNLEKIIKAAESRLANKEFIDKAPAEIIKKEKEKLKGWQAELKSLKSK